jgi:hypothetical protein
MTPYIRASDALRDAFGCSVPIVHHCGHDDARMRGFSGLQAALDAEISVTLDKATGIITVTVVNMKDDESGTVILSRLSKPFEVARDSKGAIKTGCVIEEVKGMPSSAVAEKKPPKQTGHFEQSFHDVF